MARRRTSRKRSSGRSRKSGGLISKFFKWLGKQIRKLGRLLTGKKVGSKKRKDKKTVVQKQPIVQKKKRGNRVSKSKRRKNVSQTIPNGRTLQTRDEYFWVSKDYRKPGYEEKGLYRGAVVVDSNRDNELAVVRLTKSPKGVLVKGSKVSKYRPFVETLDDEGNPIKIGEKFKENKPQKDISPAAVVDIKKLSFKNAGNAEENRDAVRKLKKRK